MTSSQVAFFSVPKASPSSAISNPNMTTDMNMLTAVLTLRWCVWISPKGISVHHTGLADQGCCGLFRMHQQNFTEQGCSTAAGSRRRTRGRRGTAGATPSSSWTATGRLTALLWWWPTWRGSGTCTAAATSPSPLAPSTTTSCPVTTLPLSATPASSSSTLTPSSRRTSASRSASCSPDHASVFALPLARFLVCRHSIVQMSLEAM